MDLGGLIRTREFLKDGIVAFALKAVKKELALGGFAGAVEAFNGNEGTTAGWGGGGGHGWWNGGLLLRCGVHVL